MRKIFLFLPVLFVLPACKQESKNKFDVTGKIVNAPSKKVYLEEAPLNASHAMIVDSSDIAADGSFHLKSSPKEESLFALYLKDSDRVIGQFINDAPSIKINADVSKNSFLVEGSEVTNSLKQFVDETDKKRMELYQLANQINQLQQSGVSDSIIFNLMNAGEQKNKELKNSIELFLKNSQSPVASIIVLDRYSNSYREEEVQGLMNKTAEKFPAHKGVQSAKEMFDNRVAANKQRREAQPADWTGKPAPEINLPDVNGNKIALSSFKGKFVLVDFWASWCKPCRAENPNVVKAYNQFKNKNFTILGVSLDSEKDEWLKAIQRDGLTWTHVSDLKEWNSEVVPVYGFAQTGIPFNVLVDPSGKIIAQGLRGDALERKLAEVLK